MRADKGKTIYMHFSFKQPKGEKYAVFAQVYYADKECKQRITYDITADVLWDSSDQHTNSVQSYYKALESIYNNQVSMIKAGIDNVVLITSNSRLVKWALGRGRKTPYSYLTDKVVDPFRFGEPKGLQVGVGMMEAVETDRVKRYCSPDRASNLADVLTKINSPDNKKYAFNTPKKGKSILDIIGNENVEIETGMIEL